MTQLANRRILVVGAGTRRSPDPDAPVGNGRAISVLCAREGATVACADVDEAAANETAELVRAEGAHATVVVGDVTDDEQCARIVAEAVAQMGGLDGLVCNVGIGAGGGLANTTVEQWDEQQLIELCMVVGQYHLVAMTLNSLGVEPETDDFPSLPA